MMIMIDMTIPDTCSECRLSVLHFGKLYCPYLDGMVGNEGKDERCPLVDAGDQFADVSKKGNLISRKAVFYALECMHFASEYERKYAYSLLEQIPTAQPDVPDINVGDINKFIDGLVEIFADIRESNVDDSVCGLCEFDGAYIGESGDWCNECPGFNRDDCFKLRDGIRKKWIAEITACMPTAQPERTGNWVEIGDEPYDEWECDRCGFVIDGSGCIDPEEYRDIYIFCPNCGCRMLKEGE